MDKRITPFKLHETFTGVAFSFSMPNDLEKLKHLCDVLKDHHANITAYVDQHVYIEISKNLMLFIKFIESGINHISHIPEKNNFVLIDLINSAGTLISVMDSVSELSAINERIIFSINTVKMVLNCYIPLAVAQVDVPVSFFFQVSEEKENKQNDVVVKSDVSRPAFFEKVFFGYDMKMKNIKLMDKIIMPDRNMHIVKEADSENPCLFRYFLIMFGKKFCELKPNSDVNFYHIEIVPTSDSFRQPNEFIVPLTDPRNNWMRLNISFKTDTIVNEGTVKECIEQLKEYSSATLFVLIRNPDDLNRAEIPFVFDENSPESLKLKASKPAAPAEQQLIAEGQPIHLENVMYFRIESTFTEASLYECLQAKLTKTGESQLTIIENHINLLANIRISTKSVYGPFTSLIQSSGFGKTKLCIELLCKHPGLYMVFRDPGQTGVPGPAKWMNEFGKFVFDCQIDELPKKDILMKTSARNYTSGRFLIALLAMINAYKKWFISLMSKSNQRDEAKKISDTVKKLGAQYLLPMPDSGDSFSVSFSANTAVSFGNVIKNIDTAIAEIRALTKSNYPFLLFIDEADVFSERKSPGRLPGINVIRRGLHLLDLNTNLMVVAIGTNSDALDFTPAVRDNSLRDFTRKDVLSPFFLTHNWDVLLSSLDLKSIEISDKLVLNKAFFNVLVAMGRPVWGSLELQHVVDIAAKKLENGSPNCVAALVARLLVRANLSVNVHHILARTLVRSFMVIVNHISTDARTMKIGYSSEPVLAFAARKLLQGTEPNLGPDEESKEAHAAREASFRALKKMVEHQAIDKGRLVEFIFEQLSLFAADDAVEDLELIHEPRHDKIPVPFQAICLKRSHILQSFNDAVNESFPLPAISESDYRAMSVGSYLKKYFSRNTHDAASQLLPDYVMKGIVNVSHYVQLERTKSEDFEELNCRVSGSKTEPIIDRALLKCGVMRCCGFVMPPNYYGIDFIVPYIIDIDSLQTETDFTRPVYSFIAIQSKTVKETVHDCAYKMAASAHLVRCPSHSDESECIKEGCNAYFTEAEMDIISKGQVTVLLAAKNTTLKELDPESTISMNGDFYKSLREQIKAKKTKFDKMLKDKSEVEGEGDIEGESELEKMELEMNELKSNVFKSLGYSSGQHPDFELETFPKKKDSRRTANFPDKIITHRLNENYTLQQMYWNKPDEKKKDLLCIAANDLKCFKHLVGENCLAVMRELVDMDSSNLNHVENILRPAVQDSLLNGIFSPYTELNPVLRSMRGLPLVDVPKINSLTPTEWKNTINAAAKGPLEEEITDSLSETYVKAIQERAEKEIKELYDDEEDEKAMAD